MLHFHDRTGRCLGLEDEEEFTEDFQSFSSIRKAQRQRSDFAMLLANDSSKNCMSVSKEARE